jgi:Tfp pilus assembly protein PilF
LRKAADLAQETPLMVSALARAYALMGNKQQAEKLLSGLIAQSKKRYVSPFYIAIVYAGLGQNELAMDWLEKAYDDRSNGLVFIRVDPELDTLRSNPRFVGLEAKLNLPE